MLAIVPGNVDTWCAVTTGLLRQWKKTSKPLGGTPFFQELAARRGTPSTIRNLPSVLDRWPMAATVVLGGSCQLPLCVHALSRALIHLRDIAPSSGDAAQRCSFACLRLASHRSTDYSAWRRTSCSSHSAVLSSMAARARLRICVSSSSCPTSAARSSPSLREFDAQRWPSLYRACA